MTSKSHPLPTSENGPKVRIEHAVHCAFRHAHPSEHGEYCLHPVGIGATGHTPTGEKVELSVHVVSRLGEDGASGTPMAQLVLFLADGQTVTVDLPSRDARRVASDVDEAEEIASGVRR